MKRVVIYGFLAVVGLALAGCSGMGAKGGPGAQVEDHGTTAPGAQQGSAAQGATTGTAQLGDQFAGQPLDPNNPKSPLSHKVFYFAFNSSQVAQADLPYIAAHAQYLSTHPNVTVQVQGNTDERGSREYNLALGERRAEAVAKLLMLQGASQGQLKIISFGEERPVALGHDEAAWQQNRRVQLVYGGK